LRNAATFSESWYTEEWAKESLRGEEAGWYYERVETSAVAAVIKGSSITILGSSVDGRDMLTCKLSILESRKDLSVLSRMLLRERNVLKSLNIHDSESIQRRLSKQEQQVTHAKGEPA
jgi:hypothetical protein